MSDVVGTTTWTVPALRAARAHERVLELQAQLTAEIELRNRAIREAVDGGANKRQLAKAVGLTPPTIYGILGTAP